jgi:hypothetical protein
VQLSRRQVALVAMGVAACLTVGAMAALTTIPVPKSASGTISFSIPLPYNDSELRCAYIGFTHTGSFSFVATEYGTNILDLSVEGPNGANLYASSIQSQASGTFPVTSALSIYSFCLLSTVAYDHLGAASLASFDGTLTYSAPGPVL